MEKKNKNGILVMTQNFEMYLHEIYKAQDERRVYKEMLAGYQHFSAKS